MRMMIIAAVLFSSCVQTPVETATAPEVLPDFAVEFDNVLLIDGAMTGELHDENFVNQPIMDIHVFQRNDDSFFGLLFNKNDIFYMVQVGFFGPIEINQQLEVTDLFSTIACSGPTMSPWEIDTPITSGTVTPVPDDDSDDINLTFSFSGETTGEIDGYVRTRNVE